MSAAADDAACSSGAGLAARLRSSAAERETAYARLLQLEADHWLSISSGGKAESAGEPEGEATESVTDIAVACVAPLCEVLCKAVSEVEVAEHHRAWQVLTALTGVDPTRVGGEAWKPDQCNYWSAMMASDSVLGVMLAKDPGSLTIEDAITAACAQAVVIIQMSGFRACDSLLSYAGVELMNFMEKQFSPGQFVYHLATPSDERNLALFPLLLELVQAPERLPDFALSGALCALASGCAGRPAVAALLLERETTLDVYMRILRQVSPSELVATAGFSRRPQGNLLAGMLWLADSAQAGGVDLTAQLLSVGFIDLVISALSAVEKLGAENVNGFLVVWCIGLMILVDGEALPQIEDKLRTIPRVFRYLKDSKISHCDGFGMSAGVYGTVAVANLWGKDEENVFEFARRF